MQTRRVSGRIGNRRGRRVMRSGAGEKQREDEGAAASAGRKSHAMQFHAIDGYLLDGRPSKADAIAAVLSERVTDERAAPFYRAFEAVGVRAADEALVAMRLVLAGRPADDAAIRRLRGLAALARASDAKALAAVLAKDGAVLTDVVRGSDDPATVAPAARAAYTAEVSS